MKSLSIVVSTSKLAPDWLHKSEQPIRSQVSKLTYFFTTTTTHKFPLQAGHAAMDTVEQAGHVAMNTVSSLTNLVSTGGHTLVNNGIRPVNNFVLSGFNLATRPFFGASGPIRFPQTFFNGKKK